MRPLDHGESVTTRTNSRVSGTKMRDKGLASLTFSWHANVHIMGHSRANKVTTSKPNTDQVVGQDWQ